MINQRLKPHTLFDKPFVLSIAPQRCGTSWIYKYFQYRGDVCLPSGVKEIFYFDRHFQRGPEFYLSHFNPQPDHELVAELTTTLFDQPEAPARVYDLLGDNLTFLCVLRRPADRALAVFHDLRGYGIVSPSLKDAVSEAPQILSASRYTEHLERWFEVFGPRRVKIVFYEHLQKTPQGFADRICRNFSLSRLRPPPDLLQRDYKRGLWAELERLFVRHQHSLTEPALPEDPSLSADREWLDQRLAPEALKLERLIGRVPSSWKKRK